MLLNRTLIYNNWTSSVKGVFIYYFTVLIHIPYTCSADAAPTTTFPTGFSVGFKTLHLTKILQLWAIGRVLLYSTACSFPRHPPLLRAGVFWELRETYIITYSSLHILGIELLNDQGYWWILLLLNHFWSVNSSSDRSCWIWAHYYFFYLVYPGGERYH